MRVDGSNSEHQINTTARLQPQPKGRGATRAAANRAAESPATINPGTGSPTAPAGESAQGAVQLLREGHFRGVADVRLRINFAEELQAIQSAGQSAALKDGIPALQGELDAAIDAFVEAGGRSEAEVNTLRAAQETFNGQVADLLVGAEEGSSIAEEVFAELRTAFEDYLNALTPPREESSEGVGNTEFRATLTAIFETGLGELEASASESILPELSDPNGNGGAFEKFLEIYRNLYQSGGENGARSPDTGLDTSS